MDPARIEALLKAVRDGATPVEEAMQTLARLPFDGDDELTLDHHRALRTHLVEVVFGQGKTPAQITRALAAIAERGQPALATRVRPDVAAKIELPEAEHDPVSRTVRLGRAPALDAAPVAVICAGTSDLPVAEEAAITLETFGATVRRLRDVGVAGLHRLLARRAELDGVAAAIVVAGMEGALPSVVGGLTGAPVIAVPTSIGYGASFDGLAALLGMLNSCAPGVAVVNVDNGYGAAAAALRILHGP